MLCENCIKHPLMVEDANTICLCCGKKIPSVFPDDAGNHFPKRMYCEECSSRIGVCQSCGASLWEQLSFFDDNGEVIKTDNR